MSPDYDEYDALLEEPFGDDVDWAAIDLLSHDAPPITVESPPTHSIVDPSSVLENESVTPPSLHEDDVIIISSSLSADNPPPPPPRSRTHSSRKKTPKSKRQRETSSESPAQDQISSGDSTCKSDRRKRAKKKKYIRDIESILECTICFNIIAAAHSLPCGHTACGICLHKWLDPAESNHPCFICREPSKGFLVPNFSIDQLAEMHFENKLDKDDKEKEEYQQWLSRAQCGRQRIQQFNKKWRESHPDPEPPGGRARRQRQR